MSAFVVMKKDGIHSIPFMLIWRHLHLSTESMSLVPTFISILMTGHCAHVHFLSCISPGPTPPVEHFD